MAVVWFLTVSLKVEGESQQTALHLSVRYTAVSAVRILTSYGAHVNAVDSSGMTPLHMAAGMLHKDIIANLIRQGADLTMVCVCYGRSHRTEFDTDSVWSTGVVNDIDYNTPDDSLGHFTSTDLVVVVVSNNCACPTTTIM